MLSYKPNVAVLLLLQGQYSCSLTRILLENMDILVKNKIFPFLHYADQRQFYLTTNPAEFGCSSQEPQSPDILGWAFSQCYTVFS